MRVDEDLVPLVLARAPLLFRRRFSCENPVGAIADQGLLFADGAGEILQCTFGIRLRKGQFHKQLAHNFRAWTLGVKFQVAVVVSS